LTPIGAEKFGAYSHFSDLTEFEPMLAEPQQVIVVLLTSATQSASLRVAELTQASSVLVLRQ
jgi:hypothetical protein